MMRFNLGLLLVVVVSAFYLVHTQYESRRLYTAIDKAQAQTHKLEVEHEQLRVLKREQATPARVQQLAASKLAMRPVTPGITQYVTMGDAAAASSPVRAPAKEVRP